MNSKPRDLKLELQGNSWLRIGLAAKDKERVFTNLFCHFNMENLREAFHAQDGSKAVGIDGITKGEYSRNLDGNLNDLLMRLHKGTYRPRLNFLRREKQAFGFLGFTFYWGKDRGSHVQRLRVKTEQKRPNKKIVEYSQWVKENRAKLTTSEIWDGFKMRMQQFPLLAPPAVGRLKQLIDRKCMLDKLNQLSEEPVAVNPHGGFCEELTLLAREE
jgi:hypothetical protein